MRLSQITIRLGETVPTAQFANVRPEVELTALVDAGDDPVKVKESLKGMAMRALEELKAEMLGIRPAHKQNGPTVSVGFAGHNQAQAATSPTPPTGIPAVEPTTW